MTSSLLEERGFEGGLVPFLEQCVRDGDGASVVQTKLSVALDPHFVVDRRTVARWMDGVS
jgi:hypothetical protein